MFFIYLGFSFFLLTGLHFPPDFLENPKKKKTKKIASVINIVLKHFDHCKHKKPDILLSNSSMLNGPHN